MRPERHVLLNEDCPGEGRDETRSLRTRNERDRIATPRVQDRCRGSICRCEFQKPGAADIAEDFVVAFCLLGVISPKRSYLSIINAHSRAAQIVAQMFSS